MLQCQQKLMWLMFISITVVVQWMLLQPRLKEQQKSCSNLSHKATLIWCLDALYGCTTMLWSSNVILELCVLYTSVNSGLDKLASQLLASVMVHEMPPNPGLPNCLLYPQTAMCQPEQPEGHQLGQLPVAAPHPGPLLPVLAGEDPLRAGAAPCAPDHRPADQQAGGAVEGEQGG